MISIIVPIYNTEDYIDLCVKSILGQTFKNFELILVDDGSTDNSYSICNELASNDNRIILLQKENGGQGSARNLALNIAKGEYIGFVDSDDYIQPEMYETLLNYIIQYNAEIAVCSYNTYRQDFKKLTPLILNKGIKQYDNHSLMKAYVSSGEISTGPCNKLYKSNLFNVLRFPEFRLSEDAYLLPDILSITSKAVHVGLPLYNWHLREDSTERGKFSRSDYFLLTSTEHLQNVIKKNYIDLFKYVSHDLDFCKALIIKKILLSNGYNNNKIEYKRLQSEIVISSIYWKQYKVYWPNRCRLTLLAKNFDLIFRLYVFFYKTLKIYIVPILRKF
jgi:glycosyltransferase involved in cell wall biosynthesis